MSFDCLLFLIGSNWIIHIVNELIFAASKKKYEHPEFPVLECGDPEKYQVSTKPMLRIIFENDANICSAFQLVF